MTIVGTIRLTGKLLLLASLLLVCSCNLLDRSAEARTLKRHGDLSHQHVHLVRHQLEKWAADHNGMYPDDINDLIADGMFEEFPQNPATRSAMRNVELSAEDRSGNFTYYPVYGNDSVIGFYLLGYGFDELSGEDVNGDGVTDNVQLVLKSGTNQLPPVEEVVMGQHSTPPLLFSRLENLHGELSQWAQVNSGSGNEVYPESLEPGSSPVELPQNPFHEGKMRPVAIGSENRAGNFAYIPFRFNGQVRGYYLLGFGTGDVAGYDVDRDGTVDNVVKILRNGPDSMPELHVLIGQLRDG